MTQELESFGHFLCLGNSSCEDELQELMRQIDIMVHNKKMEWERKLKALEARLEIRDQEIIKARSTVEQKNEEVGSLRQKLESTEKSQHMMVQNYEGQLQSLKYQFGKLKNTYQKLQVRSMKQTNFNCTENASGNQENPFNINKLNEKLEEFKAKSKEWEDQRIFYQKQLASLDAQRKSLAEKCELFQKQSQTYQVQLNCWRRFQDEAIVSSHSDNIRLRCQLDTFQETIKSDEIIIEKLKFAVSEITSSRDTLQKENQQLLQELKRGQEKCQKLEAELSMARIELRSRDGLLQAVEMEHMELQKELTKYRESRATQENAKSLESSHAQCIQLNEELAKKKLELLLVEQDQEKQQKELNKMRNHLFQQEQFHGSELERMKAELSDLNGKLCQRDITIATIIEDGGLLERQLKAELEIKEKQLSKQQSLTSFKEQQESYAVSISKLQDENSTLQNHLMKLQSKLEISLEAMEKHTGALRNARQDVIQMKEDEDSAPGLNRKRDNRGTTGEKKYMGQCQIVDRTLHPENEWQINTTVDDSIRYYTTKDNAQHSESDITPGHSGRDTPSETLSRDLEQTVDGMPLFSTVGCHNHQNNLLPEPDMSNILLNSLYSKEDSSPPSSPDMSFSAAEHFLQEEEKRAKEFEKILSSHIEELHKNSEKTLAKYITQNRHI